MRSRWWLAWVLTVCCVAAGPVALYASSASARARVADGGGSSYGGGSSAAGGTSPTAAAAIGSPALVIAGAGEELLGGEQSLAQRRADLANPAAVAERWASRTRFEQLGTAQALRVEREAFPEVVDETVGGAPRLPAGERILKYEARNAAAIALPDGGHGVVESLGPIATPSGHGRFTPINLALHSTGNGYAPANSDVAVQISKHASGGVSMPGDGVSLTPVNAQGQPLGGAEGAQEGASVVYANTQTDTDTLAKPTTGGFEIDSLLRSVDSPRTLYFKVGMPSGAKLVSSRGPGAARVVLNGQTIAGIALPGTQDATGTYVPMKMRVDGDMLVVAVKLGSGEYQYPIEIDPQAYDEDYALPGHSESETETNLESDHETDWRYYESPSGKFKAPYVATEGYDYDSQGSITPDEHSEFRYGAHGQASVGFIEETSSTGVSAASGAVTKLEFASHKDAEEKELVLGAAGQQYTNAKEGFGDLWNESEKHYQGHNTENLVRIMQTATTHTELPAEDFFWFQLNFGTWVSVNQKTGPSASFSTSESVIPVKEGGTRQNVLYGSNRWLGEDNGAVAVSATDPGLGISYSKIKDLTSGPHGEHWTFVQNIYAEHLCTGVWCNPYYPSSSTKPVYFTYNNEMAEGPNTFEFCAEDEALMSACTDATVDVDNSSPSSIQVKGLAESGAELSATSHQITVEASDELSGIQSITATVDGKAISSTSGSCLGKCTATDTSTIDGENLGAGEHTLVVTAQNYAGKGLEKVITFAIRNATPVQIGPGKVDPVTGQFALGASDVNVAGVGGVSRSYLSRSPDAGIEGPFGPSWGLSVGNGQSLKLLPNGSAELRSSGGLPTTFKYEKGQFVAPRGDENITLTKKGTEYLLQNPMAGTTVKFILPSGSGVWVPSANEGPAPGDATTYSYRSVEVHSEFSLPASSGVEGIATGPEGDLWFADWSTSKIEKITTSGERSEYSLPESSEPMGITAGPDGNMWYTDSLTNKVGKMTPSGVKTEYSLPENSKPMAITVGPEGNLWFADNNTSKIERITTSDTEKKEYPLPTNSHPMDIVTGPEGDLWFTDFSTNKIGKINPSSGALTEYPLLECVSPEGIAAGPDGNLWFACGHKIGKITPFGAVTEYSVPSEKIVHTITAGVEGNLWVAGNTIGKVTTSGVVTEYPLPEKSRSEWITVGPDDNIWFSNQGANSIGMIAASGAITEPTEVLGPVPAGVTCGKNPQEVKLEELKPGCRALTFTYAEKTTATSGSLGEYNGRLTKVSFTGYNPSSSSKKMETVVLAQYAYDNRGRLRAEWNPQVESSTACGKTCSALKTTYGYDTEGHVTALTPAGEQPWVFTYGAIPGEGNMGRLLKVTRAQPRSSESEEEIKKKLGEEKEPSENKQLPSLTGVPKEGKQMAVSNGVWSNSPVAYAYRWEDCNSEGHECTPIVGANNQNYTPVGSDVGHRIMAQVEALGGGGAVIASSAASTTVSGGIYMQTVDSGYELRSVSCISGSADCVIGDSAGKALYATNVSTSAEAAWKTWSGPSGQSPSQAVDCPTTSLCLLADGKESAGGNHLYYATSLGGSWSEAFHASWGVDAIACVSSSLCVSGQNGQGYFSYSAKPASTSWESETSGSSAMKSAFCLSSSFCVLSDSNGRVHVATSASQIESSSWKETDVDGVTALNGVACTSTSACVAVDAAGNALRLKIESSGAATASTQDIDGSTALTGVTCTGGSSPMCVAVDSAGHVFVSANSGETWIKQYSLGDYLTSVSCASASLCVTVDTTGKVIAFPAEVQTSEEGETHQPQPGSTVEYKVPLSGEGAPHQMTSAEMATWDQKKDLPEEATAIFPPDEPQGWPASDYKRASIGYLDAQAREVDAATPSGGISTVEYNSLNEVTRTLSTADRAIALKEGCESEKSCKSAEVAGKLSSESKYSGETQAEKEQEEKEVSEKKKPTLEPGVRLLEKLGPEHKIRLANGTEEETRDHEKFSYNEGAKEAEEKNKESYNLVTKEKSWAETAGKGALAEHEKTIAYGGQATLGWKLREPTLTTSTVEGRTGATSTAYEKETGKPLEKFLSVTMAAPVFALEFGSSGSGSGQFNHPSDAAIDASGNVWVADEENYRIEKFSPVGTYLASYGAKGTAGGQFEGPWALAINETSGNVYVTDPNNNRVEELSSSGAFVRAWGFGVSNGEDKEEVCTKEKECKAGISGSGGGQFKTPLGITVDTSGNVWVADSGNNRVEEFNSEGKYLLAVGSQGSENGQLSDPEGVAFSDGDVYVADSGNNRIEEFSPAGAYVSQWGGKGTGRGQFSDPDSIATNPSSGALYVVDRSNNRVEQFTIGGAFVSEFGSYGSGEGQMSGAAGLAVSAAGGVYVADEYNARVDVWQPVRVTPTYVSKFGSKGTEAGQLESPSGDAIDAHGDVWVADSKNNRLVEFSESGTFIKTVGWDVNTGGTEKWESCTSKCKAGSSGPGEGQFAEPTDVVVHSGVLYVADYGNNRIEELNESEGKYVGKIGEKGSEAGQLNGPTSVEVGTLGYIWVAEYANHRIDEFGPAGKFVKMFGFHVNENGEGALEICTSKCRAGYSGANPGEINWPKMIALSGTNLYLAEYTNNRVQEFSENEGKPEAKVIASQGTGNGQFEKATGIAVNAVGDLYVADFGNDRVQELAPNGTYMGQFGDKGAGNSQFVEPEGIAINSAGDLYVVDHANNRLEEWAPEPNTGNEGAKDTRTIYYTQAANSEYPSCGGHPEWASLVCQTEPDAQPGDSGPPPLPVTTTTYSMWDEPETITEKIGAVTRTTKKKYDSAGREVESEETATLLKEGKEEEDKEDKALPPVTDEYNVETGALVKESETLEGKAKVITGVFNTLGQLISYTDAEGSTTKYKYDVDGRTEEIAEPKGWQKYTYDPTTGFLTKLQDSAAGTFTATYGPAGERSTMGYPNGMTAQYTYNTIGQTTNLTYEKTTDCTEESKETCKWFKDAEAFGPKGELTYQASSLSTETYSYNEMGQLTQTEETPVGGKGCITRLYGYGEETGERTNLTTREPNEYGECASEGGVVEGHFYDVTERLVDPGVTYDGLGNATKTPAVDSGGMAITNSYYIDNQIATQEQNEKSIAYSYDPAGRTMTAKMTTQSSSIMGIPHYAGPGNSLTWTCEEAGECKEEKETKWTRNIPGIDGSLDAVRTSSGTVELELHDLRGNIVATASLSETATELSTKHNVTEFGVPNEGKETPKYSWLGAQDVVSELGTGVITQAGATYVPQLARTMQTEQLPPPGAAPNGVMVTEAYCPPELPWANASGDAGAENTMAQQRSVTTVIFGNDPKGGWQFDLARLETFNLYVAMEELREGKLYFGGMMVLLAELAGHPSQASRGLLATKELQDAEYTEQVVNEWLFRFTLALFNCHVEMAETFYGGDKKCDISMATREFGIEGILPTEAYFDPDFDWWPAVSFCSWGVCNLVDAGEIENPELVGYDPYYPGPINLIGE